jgi:hypothetical protein
MSSFLNRLKWWAVTASVSLLSACGSGGGGGAETPLPALPPTTVAPTISAAPASTAAAIGNTAQFSVTAAGTSPFTYQWKKGGVDIAGATSATYITPTLVIGDNGSTYSVAVTNAAGSVTSTSATLTVNAAAPVITAQPSSSTVVAGSTVSFEVTATSAVAVTYQWRANGVAIAGATAATYSFAAALADNGKLYSVVVSNSVGTGTATSSDATLTVSATAIAPSFATAPAAVSVIEGQSALFFGEIRGTGPMTYEWLQTRQGVTTVAASIPNKNPPLPRVSFEYPTASVSDSGTTWQLRLTNPLGSVTSPAVTLTVTPASSPLIGRAWAAAQLVETDDSEVISSQAGISDGGVATVVFLKTTATRPTLYATRGTAGAAGVAPTWSTPEIIDVLGGAPVNGMSAGAGNANFGVAVSPNGNAIAYWFNTAPCTVDTYNVTGTCRTWYAARRLAAGAWEAPALLGSFPDGRIIARINDAGDVLISLPGWVRSGAAGYADRAAVARRAGAASAYTIDTITLVPMADVRIGLDSAGNTALAGTASQNNTTDVVVYRATVGTAFSTQVSPAIEALDAPAKLEAFEMGLGGQQILLWSQTNQTNKLSAAGATSATSSYVTQPLEDLRPGAARVLTISDTGVGYLYDLSRGDRRKWLGGLWSEADTTDSNKGQALPDVGGAFSSLNCGFARNGDFLCTNPTNGRWITYDANRKLMVQAPSATALVLGVDHTNRNFGMGTPVLSNGGFAVVNFRNGYTSLPSGTAGSINNLWASFLK